MNAPSLPEPQDSEAAIPPTARAYVRRVAGENLWLWFRATDAEVVIVALTANPPVPID